jgi:hypothetical protein
MRLIGGSSTVSALAAIAVAFLSASPSATSQPAEGTSVEAPAASLRAVEGYGENDGAVPEGLSAKAWEAMRQAIERDRYQAEALSDGAVRAANDAQGYTTRGIHLRPRGTEIEVGLALSGYGYSRIEAVEPAQPHARGNRVEFDRGALTEWYVNRPAGMEQGFTLSRAPAEGRGAKPLSRNDGPCFLLKVRG